MNVKSSFDGIYFFDFEKLLMKFVLQIKLAKAEKKSVPYKSLCFDIDISAVST